MSTLAASERERPPLAAAALEAVELSKQFGGVHALRGVSLRLREGAIVGLIGPNGSGKTTLLNCVSGVFGPTSGSVLLDGAEITGKPAHEIARAGVVRTFQNVRLFDGLTTLEHVAVAALAAGGARRRDSVQVLNEGDVISEGTPAQVRSDPAVIAAYIGEEEPRGKNGNEKGAGQ